MESWDIDFEIYMIKIYRNLYSMKDYFLKYTAKYGN